VLALIVFREGRVALEIRAGQIVQEHLELRVEEILPAPGQMVEERPFMFKELIEARIPVMNLHQFEA